MHELESRVELDFAQQASKKLPRFKDRPNNNASQVGKGCVPVWMGIDGKKKKKK